MKALLMTKLVCSKEFIERKSILTVFKAKTLGEITMHSDVQQCIQS